MNTICKVSMMSVESLILNKSAQLTNAFQCELTSETFSNIESVLPVVGHRVRRAKRFNLHTRSGTCSSSSRAGIGPRRDASVICPWE